MFFLFILYIAETLCTHFFFDLYLIRGYNIFFIVSYSTHFSHMYLVDLPMPVDLPMYFVGIQIKTLWIKKEMCT